MKRVRKKGVLKYILEYMILLITGGLLYYGVEVIWRGWSHWSMMIVGGICFVLIGGLNNWYPWKLSILWQMAISSGIITCVELIAGLILNKWLGWGIWDYSNLPFNLWGQICLPYTILWFFLSFVGIVADDFFRWDWFGEQFPEYHLFTVKYTSQK